MAGDILFTSETSNVDVRFTSDSSGRMSGFTLDVQSIPCSERESFPEHGEPCDPQEVVISAWEVQQGALVTDTGNDGNYINHACQNWNIIADENQVYI